MARCLKLEYVEGTGGCFDDCKYRCTLCGKVLKASDSQLKYVCDAEYGNKYEDCEVYKRYKLYL
jgi:hypothetical protein